MSFSLDYQKSLNTCILDVHRRAGINTDPHVRLALLDNTAVCPEAVVELQDGVNDKTATLLNIKIPFL